MKHFMVLLVLSIVLASLAVAGCIGSPAPAPTSAPTATPGPTATITPSPTLIGGSDEAHVQFNYQIGTTSDYDGIKASPGYVFYLVQAKVSSDKPVQTSIDWFWLEYKENDTDSIHDRQPFSTYMFKYPTKTIGPDTGSARGGLIFELPDHMAKDYPKPYYNMPLENQQGPYKVYGKVYGTPGDVS